MGAEGQGGRQVLHLCIQAFLLPKGWEGGGGGSKSTCGSEPLPTGTGLPPTSSFA